MPDDMDLVQAINEQWLEGCLAEQRRGRGVLQYAPPTICTECGEEIPEPRRQAVPGCRRCIDCQTELERIHAHWRAL